MRVVAVAVAVLMIAGNNVLAQVAKVEDASARELAKLNATVREVADLLTKQVAQGQLDLLMKRTQMALTRSNGPRRSFGRHRTSGLRLRPSDRGWSQREMERPRRRCPRLSETPPSRGSTRK